jgi:hypothetical protein
MKMIIETMLAFLILILSSQTVTAQERNPQTPGYSNKIQWQESGFLDGRDNPQIAYNIRNGRMPCTSHMVDSSQERRWRDKGG